MVRVATVHSTAQHIAQRFFLFRNETSLAGQSSGIAIDIKSSQSAVETVSPSLVKEYLLNYYKMTNNADSEIIITTTHGQLKGLRCTSVYDEPYLSFEGVPYAQPPVGDLRFQAPHALSPWHGVWDGTKKPQKPMQKNPFNNEIEGSEDCLYLNIYVKVLDSTQPLPIMVFLHGGGFEKGDATRDLHGPDYFMSKQVILITIGYRLGALGFLSLNDPSLNIPGNAGLKDQLLALQWIKQNVQNFNGDPNNITLFGESAGAGSTHYLMLTPHAKGLFHKAILQSGNALAPWAIAEATNLGYRLAKANGYESKDYDSDVLDYLKLLPAEELVRPYFLTAQENLNDCIFTFGPVVEPYESTLCIIPCKPFELLPTAWANDIPIMLGGTSFEGLLMYPRVLGAPFLLTELQKETQHMLPFELKKLLNASTQRQLGDTIKQAHFGENDVSLENVFSYCDYASYKCFWHPIFRLIKARMQYATKKNTFFYRFDYDSPNFNHQRIKYCGPDVRGVAHVDDHSYLFYGAFSWKLDCNSGEYRTIQRMIDIWTTFAMKSDPNCDEIKEIDWQPLTCIANNLALTELDCVNIGQEVKLISLPEMQKLLVWEKLYEHQ